MSNQCESMESFEKGWKPRGIWAWLLTTGAGLLVLITVIVGYCMVVLVRFDSLPGFAAAHALFFSLHVLLFTVVAAALWYLAARQHVRLAAWGFGLASVLSLLMCVIPTFAVMAKARELQVSLSLGDYLANAGHMNAGLPQAERTVSYGTAKDGAKLELDVWRTGQPNTGPLRPAMVFSHGGGWVLGNRSMRPDWNRWLNQLGYEVFDVEYRMPPPVRWMDEVGDVKAAIGWVAAHAAGYHVDPTRISVMGTSAGANLSLLAAYSMGEPGLPPSTNVAPVAIRSVVDLWGPAEMALVYRTADSPDFVQGLVKQYIGGTPDEFPERYRAVSPLYHITAKAPPTIIIQGTSDRIVPFDQATMLDQALTKAGVVHESYILPATDHGFDVNWGGFATQIARAKIADFLQRH